MKPVITDRISREDEERREQGEWGYKQLNDNYQPANLLIATNLGPPQTKYINMTINKNCINLFNRPSTTQLLNPRRVRLPTPLLMSSSECYIHHSSVYLPMFISSISLSFIKLNTITSFTMPINHRQSPRPCPQHVNVNINTNNIKAEICLRTKGDQMGTKATIDTHHVRACASMIATEIFFSMTNLPPFLQLPKEMTKSKPRRENKEIRKFFFRFDRDSSY